MELGKLIDGMSFDEGLIKILQDVQKEEGFVSKNAIEKISKKFSVPVSKIYGVITFYSQFRLKPVGKHVVKVCRGTACHVSGSAKLVDQTKEFLKIPDGGDTTEDNLFTVEEVACLGCCSLAPAIMIDERVYGKVTNKMFEEIFKAYK